MRIFSTTRSKVAAGAITAGLALALVPALHGGASWGPTRNTFTWANPATYITFNSITDNPSVGDERTFYTAYTASDATRVDPISVTDNEEVTMQVYFHNNAASNLDLVAHNTTVKMTLPTGSGTDLSSTAYISADNADPSVVSDTLDLKGASPFTISYEPGSAKLWTNYVNGAALSDNVVNGGTLIGSQGADGNVPGCSQFSGYVTIKVRVHVTPPPATFACSGLDVAEVDRTHFNFTVHSTVSNASVKSYTFTAKDNGGNTVDTQTVTTGASSAQYAFNQSNAGTYTVSAVVNTDHGSTNAADCTKQITVQAQTPNPVFACTGLDATQVSRTQYDLTAHASVQNANVTSYTFTTKDSNGKVVDTQSVSTGALSAVYHFNQSNSGTYTISAVVNTDHGSTNASDCTKQVSVQPQAPNPVFACTGLSANQVDRTHYDLTASASAQNANVTSYAFTVKDSNGNTVDTQTVNTSALSAVYHFNQSNAGTYTVSAVVNTDKGSTKAGDCTKQITVQNETPNPVFACSALNVTTAANRVITATVTPVAQNGATLQSVSYDFGDGNTKMSDQTSVSYTYAKDGTYTVAATLTFNVGSTTKTARCAQSVTITTPVTPQVLSTTTTLPNTGPEDVAGLFAGASALGAAGHYVVASRRRR